jgi:hypothetical protein
MALLCFLLTAWIGYWRHPDSRCIIVFEGERGEAQREAQERPRFRSR